MQTRHTWHTWHTWHRCRRNQDKGSRSAGRHEKNLIQETERAKTLWHRLVYKQGRACPAKAKITSTQEVPAKCSGSLKESETEICKKEIGSTHKSKLKNSKNSHSSVSSPGVHEMAKNKSTIR